MEWISLILTYLPQILECLDRDGEEATLRRLRRLGPREEFLLWRGLAQEGVPIRERRGKMQEIRQKMAESTDQDLLGIIELAKEYAASAAANEEPV